MIPSPPPVWPGAGGTPLSCREKIKVLAENHEELAQTLRDTFEDAILMGVDEAAMRAILEGMVRGLEFAETRRTVMPAPSWNACMTPRRAASLSLALLMALAAPVLAPMARAQQEQAMPPPEEEPPEAPRPPEEGVTTTPLPPPDSGVPAEMEPEMVPNPLRDPNVRPVPGSRVPQQAEPRGQAQRGGWIAMGTATLQALDKINARGQTLTVKVGEAGSFGSLEVAVKGCFVRAPDRPADATALLAVRDKRLDSAVFNGWVVRSAPYMSMMAHPIYDIRITGCAP